MTARKRTRHSPELRAEAIRLAAEIGANPAADRLGINPGTVRAWVSRAAVDGPPATTPEDEAAELEAKPAEAMGVAEWVELQSMTEQRYRRALGSGSPSDARWYAISLGVISDKLAKAREAGALDPHSGLFRRADATWERLQTPDDPRERMKRLINLNLGMMAGEAVHELREADEAKLDENIRKRYDVIRRLEREVRWIHEERTRRRLGEPSLFGMIQDPPSSRPESRTVREIVAAEAETVEPIPIPLELAALSGASAIENESARVDAVASATERYDRRMETAHARRRLRSGWQGPRRGLDPARDHPQRPA